jgi:6-phosphogluconate dehydrogenase
MSCDIGLFGLAVMGQNFALNMADHGFSVCVGNRSYSKVEATVERAKQEGNLPLIGSTDAADLCSKLSKPRKIVLLVQAGKPVDLTIAALSEHMEAGDVIIDGGNEWYPNSVRRSEELAKKGIMFLGMGISGGEEGARNGPSLMPGGPKEAYDLIAPIMTKCAAQAGEPLEACFGYLGPIGAGNYVKMVHNGIEYGDMQLISEVYDILKVCTNTNATTVDYCSLRKQVKLINIITR